MELVHVAKQNSCMFVHVTPVGVERNWSNPTTCAVCIIVEARRPSNFAHPSAGVRVLVSTLRHTHTVAILVRGTCCLWRCGLAQLVNRPNLCDVQIGAASKPVWVQQSLFCYIFIIISVFLFLFFLLFGEQNPLAHAAAAANPYLHYIFPFFREQKAVRTPQQQILIYKIF